MNYNQSIVKNLLKSTLERECLKLLSELKSVHSAGRLFHILMTLVTVCRMWSVYLGSPFHAAVVNPRRVQLFGGWESVVDPRSNSVKLKLHEPFSLEFDTLAAGPGFRLTCLRLTILHYFACRIFFTVLICSSVCYLVCLVGWVACLPFRKKLTVYPLWPINCTVKYVWYDIIRFNVPLGSLYRVDQKSKPLLSYQ